MQSCSRAYICCIGLLPAGIHFELMIINHKLLKSFEKKIIQNTVKKYVLPRNEPKMHFILSVDCDRSRRRGTTALPGQLDWIKRDKDEVISGLGQKGNRKRRGKEQGTECISHQFFRGRAHLVFPFPCCREFCMPILLFRPRG